LLQVVHEGRDWLVRFAGVRFVIGDAIGMAVPGIFEMPHRRNTTERNGRLSPTAARDETLSAKVGRLLIVKALQGNETQGMILSIGAANLVRA
jgi:hypothetical protein